MLSTYKDESVLKRLSGSWNFFICLLEFRFRESVTKQKKIPYNYDCKGFINEIVKCDFLFIISFITETSQLFLVATPVFIHFYIQLDMNLFTEEFL
ncbi:hypothetical protein LY01_02354 [Nonlabens xylanidelens]|uniref:Uncharacterized protein n=1 Tax=Nonlabens xylanidelens TaxID=191564 RepID=A0A2S6IH93_9FLAO|nr:hypothetical protein LY01_02354 [Nonlabens xylanidelens]